VDETKVNKEVYQGRLIKASLQGILGQSCNVDPAALKQAEFRYVDQLTKLLITTFPNGKCNAKTYAADVYNAFNQVAQTPPEAKKLELDTYTKWCMGKAPSNKAIQLIATMKAAFNLYSGNILLNAVKCNC
jgi:hypothetical protein